MPEITIEVLTERVQHMCDEHAECKRARIETERILYQKLDAAEAKLAEKLDSKFSEIQRFITQSLFAVIMMFAAAVLSAVLTLLRVVK